MSEDKRSTASPERKTRAMLECGGYTMFKDVYNPTLPEIRHWAYADQLFPEQDWDLFLAHSDNLMLFLELASDDQCPTRNFFKYIICLYVAEDIKTERSNPARNVKLQYYLDMDVPIKSLVVERWKSDIAKLLRSHFYFFSYKKWIDKSKSY